MLVVLRWCKGRSPSFGLRPSLRRCGAIMVAGSLYPVMHFGPTRLNVADCPTRDSALPEPCASCVPEGCSFETLMGFASMGGLNRLAANWVRLVLLLGIGTLGWKSGRESWRFSHVRFKHFPWAYCIDVGRLRAFDKTLGFPGEGPGGGFGSEEEGRRRGRQTLGAVAQAQGPLLACLDFPRSRAPSRPSSILPRVLAPFLRSVLCLCRLVSLFCGFSSACAAPLRISWTLPRGFHGLCRDSFLYPVWILDLPLAWVRHCFCCHASSLDFPCLWSLREAIRFAFPAP
jgi:hypothetical protein